MSITRIFRFASLSPGALLLVASLAALVAGMPSALLAQGVAADADGLVRREIRGLDSVAERPGVDWRNYDKVTISDVQVTFSNTWDPRAFGRFGLEPQDVAKIRDDLGKLAREEFAAALRGGGYTVVPAAGAGVLQVVPKIVDLYVNAPPRSEINPQYTYVLESGEMTLVLELRDSITGVLLGQVRDRHRDPGVGMFVLANEVTRLAENRHVLRTWALRLRSMLAETRDPRRDQP